MFDRTLDTLLSIDSVGKVLPALLAILTQKPRYFPEVAWSKDCWTHNVYRFFGMIFGERYGVNCNSSAIPVRKDGHVTSKGVLVFTFEAFLANVEAIVRWKIKCLFDKTLIPIRIVRLEPVFANPSQGINGSGFLFAIAYDNSGIGGGTTGASFSFTCTGSNLVLVMTMTNDTTDGTATYNSVAMTQVGSFLQSLSSPVNRYAGLFYLANPATGAHTAASTSTGGDMGVCVGSYTGCSQTGIPDNSNTGTNASTNTFTVALTPVAADCWIVGILEANGGMPMTASNAAFKRQEENVTNGECTLFDTNGAVNGAQNMTAANNGGGNRSWAGIIISLAPPAAAATGPRKLSLLMAG